MFVKVERANTGFLVGRVSEQANMYEAHATETLDGVLTKVREILLAEEAKECEQEAKRERVLTLKKQIKDLQDELNGI